MGNSKVCRPIQNDLEMTSQIGRHYKSMPFIISFFSKSKLSLTKILCICHSWLLRRPVSATAAETENTQVSTIQWYQHCRDIVFQKMNSVTSAFGGVGVVVHVDETVLIKRKMNRGRRRVNHVWVIGLYDTNLQ